MQRWQHKRPSMETAELIARLGIQHHAKTAYRELFGLGFAVVAAAREGLKHENASVRYYCCSLLDHFLVPEALGDLISMVRDPDANVRVMALHTLACDRCKEGDCRPAEADVLPEALRVLHEDEDAHVRAMAVEVVGQYVHVNKVAELTLLQAKQKDVSPTVRKKAGWYAPGGPIHTRTAPPIRKQKIHGTTTQVAR
jgi:HEAT repeat protein